MTQVDFRATRRRRRQAGFALLMVLWTTSLLALIGTQITSTGRREAQLAANLRGAAVAEAAADAAVFEAIYHLIDGSDSHWIADGTVHRVTLPHAAAEVTAADDSGKIDINMASLPLLSALLREVGIDQRRAQSLAAAIADWRSPSNRPLPQGAKKAQYASAGLTYGPPNAPFRTVGELRLVLGMTAEIYALIEPYVTVHLEGNPSQIPGVASPVVVRAVADAAAAGGIALIDNEDADRPPLVQVTAVAISADHGRFARRCLVRLNVGFSSGAGRPPYEILTWERINT
jgi:general secretion pathway protein K